MEEEYFKLLSVLDMLITFHRELIGVEREKLQLIINQDWRNLEREVDRSREILTNIESAETTRLDIIEKISGRRDLSLSDLEQTVPRQMREDLLESGSRLQVLVDRLKDVIRRSEQLLTSSLEVIDFTLSMFSGDGSNVKTYGVRGEEKKGLGRPTSLVFDVKA